MVNNVDPDQMAHYDLHCLQRYMFWSGGMKELTPCHTCPKI